MLEIGKEPGGGIFSFAVLIARDTRDFMPGRTLGGYTHEKNPVTRAAAPVAIELPEDGVLDHVCALSEYTPARLLDQALAILNSAIEEVSGE